MHAAYVDELISGALDGHVATDDGYDLLMRVAAALDVDERHVLRVLLDAEADGRDHGTIAARRRAAGLPAGK